ncbi:MAG TPA: DUF421 domain-containing protein [Chondromyces sp.]|nr:DUF421 domain-containing protein [Chondromyces sp.]
MTYLVIAFRTVFLYVVILLVFRLMGRREIAELSVLDLVVFLMIGEMAVMAIDNHEEPIMQSIFPIVLLVIVQILSAFFSLKSKRFRDLFDGKPEVIINDGKINEKAMRKHRYNFDDLLFQLRKKDIRDIGDVEFAILETSGDLSIFRKEAKENRGGFTLPLIIDGKLDYDHLKVIGKTEAWLRKELGKRGYHSVKEISFCSFQNGEFYIDVKDEGK